MIYVVRMVQSCDSREVCHVCLHALSQSSVWEHVQLALAHLHLPQDTILAVQYRVAEKAKSGRERGSHEGRKEERVLVGKSKEGLRQW
jgi:hypothetical protein